MRRKRTGDWVTKTTYIEGWEISQAESKDGKISLIAVVKPTSLRLSSAGPQLVSQISTIGVGHDLWQAGIDFPTTDRLDWRIFDGALSTTNRDRFPESMSGVSRLPWQGQAFGVVRQLLVESVEGCLKNARRKAMAAPQLTDKDWQTRVPLVDRRYFLERKVDCIEVSLNLLRDFTLLDDYIPDLPVPASP